MQYNELLKSGITPRVLEVVNRLIREQVHSDALQHTMESLIDCCHSTTIFFASPDGESENMVALGVIASMNLLSHRALSIHNLAVASGMDQKIAHGLVHTMVEWAQKVHASNPQNTTIQIAVPIDDDGLKSYLGSIGFRKWRDHYRLASEKPRK